MALTVTQLVAEVKDLCGRTGDTVLVTDTRVLRYLNEAQDEIIRKCVGHLDLETSDNDAITLVANTYQYSIASLTPLLAHLLDVYYMDGTQSKELDYYETDEFDERYPDPVGSGETGIPCRYTRRASKIEIFPVPSSAEAGKYLRLNYTAKPTVLTIGTGTCSMSEADKGLIYYALKECWTIIGGQDSVTEIQKYQTLFDNWLEEYRKTKDGLYGSEADDMYGD